jgi:predicted ArsR family transcriptional regulator
MDLPISSSAELLAQPSRARLFALLDELKRPAATGELAERLGLHPNGVRAHMERLAKAGLVERSRSDGRRGRPRDEWSIAPAARPGGGDPESYRELGRWLARAMPRGKKRLREVEQAGREIGRELRVEGRQAPERALRGALAALGFQPRLERKGGELCCTLGNCPYRDAVK